MSSQDTIDALNRLLAIEHRSLPMYLNYAQPWTHTGDEPAAEALRNIVANQQATAKRLADVVLDMGGQPDSGDFPMEYTDLHDLSLDYLWGALLEGQRRDIADIQACVDRLRLNPEARALAEEVLGSERAHLEQLEELSKTGVG